MRTLTLALLLAWGTPTGDAQKTANSDAETKIMALENLWSQASAIKDLKSLNDEGLVYVDPDGRLLTKEEVLADVRTSPAVQFITESMAVYVHGDTAVITGTYRLKGLERGKPFVRRGRFYAQSRNDNRALNQIFDNSPGVHRVRAPAEQVGIPGEGTDGSATSGAGLDGPNDGARIWDHRYRSWDLQGKGSEKWQALRKALALHRYLGIQKGKLGVGCGRCGTHNALSQRLQSDEPVLSL